MNQFVEFKSDLFEQLPSLPISQFYLAWSNPGERRHGGHYFGEVVPPIGSWDVTFSPTLDATVRR